MREVALLLPRGARQGGCRGERLGGVALAQRLRHVRRAFGRAHRRERRVVEISAPVEEAEESAHHRHEARRRAALQAVGHARGKGGAEIGRGKIAERREIGQAPQMHREKFEEGREVEPIGRARVRRDAALVAKPRVPRGDRAGQVG